MAQWKIVEKKSYSNWKTMCLEKKTSSMWSTTKTYSSCHFVPNKDYPDLSKINVSMWTWAWYNDYETFVPKFERLFLDLIFMIWIVWMFYWMFRLVKKLLF